MKKMLTGVVCVVWCVGQQLRRYEMTKPVTRRQQMDRFLGYLNDGMECKVLFRKVNGALRSMRCISLPAAATLGVIRNKDAKQGVNEAYVYVWDVEAKGIRTINPATMIGASSGNAHFNFKRDPDYIFPHHYMD